MVLAALFAGAAVFGSVVAGGAPEEQTVEEILATVTPIGPDEEKPYTVYKTELFDLVDFSTFNGFRRYHADCHVCHGPDGLGSTYAPALVESLKTLSYEDFVSVTINGSVRTAGTTKYVMPEFGTNPNVVPYLDDIYAYLKARSDGVLRRGRPARLPKAKKTASEE